MATPGDGHPAASTVTEPAAAGWWRRAVVYQVYIRSFADSTGDGIGDLRGLRSRLGYLRDLGVDALWVNPWYPSPLRDGGYDVAEYCDIDPRIGTLADAEEMIAAAHGVGLRVIVDLVPNHTSSEHHWFREALAAGSGTPDRRRYHFLSGRGSHGELPPNNWESLFGGPAWTRVPDGEWYLHLFDVSQPDLNWANLWVRAQFEQILRFWLDRQVDGFRVDVAHGLVKDPQYPDLPPGRSIRETWPGHPTWDRDELHDIVRGWRAVLDEYGDRMMVAEACVQPDRLARFLRPGEYHQSFAFEFSEAGWHAERLRELVPRTVADAAAVGSTPTWVLSNHDLVRHATRFGLPTEVDAKQWLRSQQADVLDPGLGLQRARAAALLMLALPGSVYLYQGEELGLPEVWDLPIDARADPVWERSRGTEAGRDGSRVPMPWSDRGPSLGFGDGRAWLPQPPGFAAMSVERQRWDPRSMLELHRRALQLRNRYGRDDESLEMLDLGAEVLAFRRGSGLCCVVNFGQVALELPKGRVLLTSGDLDGARLGPNDAVWLLHHGSET